MKKIQIKFVWSDKEKAEGIRLPSYETEGSAGMDVEAAVTEDVIIHSGSIALIPTALAVSIPVGYEIQVRPRSGLAIRHGITLINSPGTIDSDYRGEVKIGLINHGASAYTVCRGDRIAQFVVAPVVLADFVEVAVLDETERGTGGFGHTGR